MDAPEHLEEFTVEHGVTFSDESYIFALTQVPGDLCGRIDPRLRADGGFIIGRDRDGQKLGLRRLKHAPDHAESVALFAVVQLGEGDNRHLLQRLLRLDGQ